MDISNEFTEEYNLKEKVTYNAWKYIKVTKEMYGLPQAGLQGNNLLEEWLNNHGYSQSAIVPRL